MTTTLLAVDDSKTIRRVLEITFASENYRTILVENADDALSKVRAERPTVALVDAGLGASSGYDLCQQIKREAPGTAVILLSSKHAPYDRSRGNSVGADDFIDKPFDTQQLIDKVTAAARKHAEAPARAGSTAIGPGPARPATLAYGAAPAAAAAAGAAFPARTPTATGGGALAPQPQPAASQAASVAAVGSRPQAAPAPAVSAAATGYAAAAPASADKMSSWPSPASAGASAASPAPAIAPAASTGLAAATAGDGQFAQRLAGLGLTQDQVQGVLALSKDVVERVVWEVVPVLAETLIKEELRRLTSD